MFIRQPTPYYWATRDRAAAAGGMACTGQLHAAPRSCSRGGGYINFFLAWSVYVVGTTTAPPHAVSCERCGTLAAAARSSSAQQQRLAKAQHSLAVSSLQS
jgi:hypothetical protein